MKLTDEQLAEVEKLAHAAISELVFTNHHCGDDQYDEALTCLMQISDNVQRITELIASTKEAA